jgi:hypothetical protein
MTGRGTARPANRPLIVAAEALVHVSQPARCIF